MDEAESSRVGRTAELSLRVSVATLARVVFPHPDDGRVMLALDHKATVMPVDHEPRVAVKAQPFGGAVRILNHDLLEARIGRFHFDSERSRAERDFRIFIRPEDWVSVRDFCLDEIRHDRGLVIESEPSRELTEEFGGALGVDLKPDQFVCRAIRSVLENKPAPTGNVFASGSPTVRFYRIFEVTIGDTPLCRAILANSVSHPARILQKVALEDARKDGRGWANAILVAPMERVRTAFLACPAEVREVPLPFEYTTLDETVAAVLEGIPVPKYQQVPS